MHQRGFDGEDITVRDARYLPLSALDLRVLTAEIKTFLEQALAELPGGHCSKIWISGINSAHPLLEELLAEQINLEVQRIDPLAEPALDKVSYAQLLLCAGCPVCLVWRLDCCRNRMMVWVRLMTPFGGDYV